MPGTRLAVGTGLISFEAHRFLAPDVPVASVLLGGALFGTGMVLAGGCASRLTVLAGAGNLRAALVLIVFAVTAHAAMKGALVPLRELIGAATLYGGEQAGFATLPGGEIWPLGLALAAVLVSLRSGARAATLVMAAAAWIACADWLGWNRICSVRRF